MTKFQEKVLAIREEFPILKKNMNGYPIVFLDTAASAQKPESVIDSIKDLAYSHYANIHRGLYNFSEQTTEDYEMVRRHVARFINAPDYRSVIFTSNSTAAINLLARTYGYSIPKNKTIMVSELEHHANLVPWLMLRETYGIKIKVIPIDESGDIDLLEYERILKEEDVALVAMTHMSNVLGTVTDVKKLTKIAHDYNAKIVLDGSQAIVHKKIDVQDIDADFYAFTGHKIYGPTGIGILWGKYDLMKDLPPFMGGGEMIKSVSFENVTWADTPHRFEAGTPPILEAIALGHAIEFMEKMHQNNFLEDYDSYLTNYTLKRLNNIKGLNILGKPKHRSSVISFTIDGMHPHDISVLLNQKGIAIRAGQHCAEPLIHKLGLQATARISLGVYNLTSEIDYLVDTLSQVKKILCQ